MERFALFLFLLTVIFCFLVDLTLRVLQSISYFRRSLHSQTVSSGKQGETLLLGKDREREREKQSYSSPWISFWNFQTFVFLLFPDLDLTSISTFLFYLASPSHRLSCSQDGFLKAFSDDPEHFSYGISPLQTVLTQLQIRKVDLWPRFHKSVARDLGQRKADVIELYQPLSSSMRKIQNSIVECLDATLNELKKSSKTVSFEKDGSFFWSIQKMKRLNRGEEK